ncbi:MAG: LysM peptidoglycan-binding domain-containing protein [Planctomycetota bacterium]|nr:LysM peptidoglycan-binding domain-containing protein [Planctomycetota bacterium]
MRDPQNYFTDPIEQELAAEAWLVGENPSRDMFYTMVPPHGALESASESQFQKRLVRARNWITCMRDQPLPWGETGVERVTSYFKTQLKRDFVASNLQIANVEHFFTSAMITATSGAFYGPVQLGVAGYEVFLQPIGVALANLSISRGWNNMINGWKQLAGPDRRGIEFVLMNSNFAKLDVQQFFSTQPTVVESVPLPPKQKPAPPSLTPPDGSVPVNRGDSISAIAGRLYGSVELWPLIWDMNKATFPNPNRISPGSTLNYKMLSTYTQAQIADAKRRSPTWRDYPQ